MKPSWNVGWVAALRALALVFVRVGLVLAGSSGVQTAEHHAGPDQTFPSIGSLPWDGLGPGYMVFIHWRAEAYHEKVFISNSGEAERPIRIVGVPGPHGQRPVMSVGGRRRRGFAFSASPPLRPTPNFTEIRNRSAIQARDAVPAFATARQGPLRALLSGAIMLTIASLSSAAQEEDILPLPERASAKPPDARHDARKLEEAVDSAGFVSLFDGRSPDGWRNGAEGWSVQDDNLVYTAPRKGGAVVVDANLDEVQPIDGDDHPGLKRERGYIGFLGHTKKVEYRNIRIKELPSR